ncbi:hypothetical protein F5880DRAFT_1734439 [Lentinula raphanica]|nr:hypothetical protein F5880DRAFT_1734439 [Lentinula raphanica]
MPIANFFERAAMMDPEDTSFTVLEYGLRKQQIADYAAFAKLATSNLFLDWLALLVYDIFLNLDREVRLVWRTSDRFRWSNVIYYTNRYPVVAYQIWSVCYTPKTPQFFWYFSFIPTRVAISASWILRVYAVVDHGLIFGLILTVLGLAIIAFDILQGVQSTCTHNTLSSETLSGVMTYICLAVFDILATSLVTIRMCQAIHRSGGFHHIDKQNLSEYVLRSGVLYFGVVTVPQLIAVVLYFAPQGLYSPILNNFLLILSSVMIARFLLGLREMNEMRREYTPGGEYGSDLDPATTVSMLTWNVSTETNSNFLSSSGRRNVVTRRGAGNHSNSRSWWAGGTSLVADFDAEIEVR